ncbi:ATP-binding protein [Streptomyces sp. NPDC056987]|uniref:ATP-binding protein n=1 Tax=Streptomyces sp. NPDC056987 TaxID=3345988 RepID=UPI00362CB153
MQQPLTSDPRSHGDAEWALRPELAAEAREAAHGFLAALVPEPSARTSQNLVLLVSELVANAIRHAGEVTSLHLRADRRSLHVVVDDPSPARPRERTPDLTGGTGGFGWPMIQRLAEKVTVLPNAGGGKTIRAVLAR